MGYPESQASQILIGGQIAKDKIDLEFKLRLLGNSESYAKREVEKVFSSRSSTYSPAPRQEKAVYRPSYRQETKPLTQKFTQPNSIKAMVEKSSREENIPKALIYAVIRTESNFNPRAVSDAGAVGLMQLMEAAAYDTGVRDRFDPRQNIAGGTKYLRMMLDQFGSLDLALAAYNAGPGTVESIGRRVPNNPGVRQYIKDVKKFYKEYSNA